MKDINRINVPSGPAYLSPKRSSAQDFAIELARKRDDKAANQAPAEDKIAVATSVPSAPLVPAIHAEAPQVAEPVQAKAAGVIEVSTAQTATELPLPIQSSFMGRLVAESGANPAPPNIGVPTTLSPPFPSAVLTTPASVSASFREQPLNSASTTSDEVANEASSLAESEGDTTASWVAAQEQLNVVVQPTGITETLLGSRVYGVHLFAGAYLSELTASSPAMAGTPPDAALPEAADLLTGISASQPMASSSLGDTAPAMTAQEDALAMLNLLASGEVAVMEDGPRGSGTAAIASEDASTLFWPESSLRLTKQQDGSAVVWLRDYRMRDGNASHLVDVLLKGARAQGMHLSRIVLNGHEVWASHTNH